MIELMTAFSTYEKFTNNTNNTNEDIVSQFMNNIPITWIIAAFIISFGASYLAFECSCTEKPATRAIYTILAFFFSGFYLIYYLVVHVILGYQCFSGKNISNIIKSKK